MMEDKPSEPHLSEMINDTVSVASTGALRVALLFGSAAIALTLILTPLAERQAKRVTLASGPVVGIDQMTTGSIPSQKKTYTIRRSVLQDSTSDLCVIQADGRRIGAC